MRITAAVMPGRGEPFRLETLELDEPRPDEVLVRVVATGMCHTDLHVRDQAIPTPLPAVLGHEGAGIVERVGSAVTKVAPGDPVVMTFHSCGHCRNCRAGAIGYCDDSFGANFAGRRFDGSATLRRPDGGLVHGAFFHQSSFATHALATERNVVKVPRDVPLERMGPFACGFQTGAGSVMNTLRPPVGSAIAVLGTGAVGLAAVIAAAIVGCGTIIGVDLKPARLALARQLGATHTIEAGAEDAVAAVRRITGGGADFSLDTTADPRALRLAVDCLRPAGVCGLVGGAPRGAEVSLDVGTMLRGRVLRGIIEGDSIPDLFIPQLIRLYRQGRFPVDPLVRLYPLAEINQAAHDAESGTVIKPILVMPGVS